MPDFTVKQKKYASWLATPPENRPTTLQTEAQLAAKLGVSVHDFEVWARLPGFEGQVFRYARSILTKKMAEVMQAIYRRALKGNVAAQKLYFGLLGIRAEEIHHNVHIEEDRLIIMMDGRERQAALPSPPVVGTLLGPRGMIEAPQEEEELVVDLHNKGE